MTSKKDIVNIDNMIMSKSQKLDSLHQEYMNIIIIKKEYTEYSHHLNNDQHKQYDKSKNDIDNIRNKYGSVSNRLHYLTAEMDKILTEIKGYYSERDKLYRTII